MVDVTVEKTEEELRKELEALQRQQRESVLGIQKGFVVEVFLGIPRNFGPNQRGFVRPIDRTNLKDEPPAKRRLCSAVVKVDGDGEVAEGKNPVSGEQNEGSAAAVLVSFSKNDQRSSVLQQSRLGSAKNSDLRADNGADHQVKEPRVLPKDEDPRLVNRNRRMLGQLLGTLEKFKKEDMQLSGTDAYMRKSSSLQKLSTSFPRLSKKHVKKVRSCGNKSVSEWLKTRSVI